MKRFAGGARPAAGAAAFFLAAGLCFTLAAADPGAGEDAAAVDAPVAADGGTSITDAEPQRVVVTATRIPTPEAHVANSVSVVAADIVENRQYRELNQVLETIPGVSLTTRSGGAGQESGLFMRGLSRRSTKIMVDGMPLNDPSSAAGEFNFGQFALDNVDQLEVLRGATSTLYGASASAGVVNLTSKRGEGPLTGYVSTEAGSRGTAMTRVGLSAGADKVDFSLGGSLYRTDGVSAYARRYRFDDDRDGHEYGNLSLRLGVNPGECLRIDLYGNFHKSSTEYDSAYRPSMWGSGKAPDASMEIRTERQMIRPEITLTLFDGRWEQKIGYGYVHTGRKHRSEYDSAWDRVRYKGETWKFDYQSILRLHETNALVAGVDVVTESMRMWEKYYGVGNDPGWKSDKVTTTGFFLEDQVNIRDVFFATAGVRHEIHDDFGEKTTWNASVKYVLPTGTSLMASAGTGFNAPSLYELYGHYNSGAGYVYSGNPDLKPEHVFGWDAGFEQAFLEERLVFGSTFFRNKVRDGIAYDVAAYKNDNIREYRTWGFESFVRFAVTECLSLSAQHTWTRIEKGGDKGDKAIQHRRPLHEFSFNVDWRFLGRGLFTAGVAYTGRRWDYYDDNITGMAAPVGNDVRMPSYTVARVAASWKVNDNLEIFGRVENLFNKRYETTCGYGRERLGAYAGVTLSF